MDTVESRQRAIRDVCSHFGRTKRPAASLVPGDVEAIVVDDDAASVSEKTTPEALAELYDFNLTDSTILLSGEDPLHHFRSSFFQNYNPDATQRVRIFDVNRSKYKYGRWRPQDRYSLDQVPCCLSEGEQRAYDDVGSDK